MKLFSKFLEKKYIPVPLVCFFSMTIYSQQLPEVVPPSPETAALFKYHEYPMDFSTGLPQISIPLFEIKSGDLVVPISMSYHASGCKVSDRDGAIAKGWSLDTGAAVSRTIHGATDFGNGCDENFPFPQPFVTDNVYPNSALDRLAYLESIMHYSGNPALVTIADFVDSEYDIFSFNILGGSGKLVFEDNNGTKIPQIIPPKPYQIAPVISNCRLSGLDLIDDGGVLYKFVGSESNTYGPTKGTTAYAISEIISADKTDTISYTYQGGFQTRISAEQFIRLEDKYHPPPNNGPQFNENTETNISSDDYQISRLSEINYGTGRAVFNLVDGPYGNEKHIDNIQIYDRTDAANEIKTIKFHRSPLHNWPAQQAATHKLDSLTIHDRNGLKIEKYAFEHHGTTYVDASSTETLLNFRYIDWWGYYNGSGEWDMVPRHTNISVLPATTTYDLGNINGDREPKLNAMLSGVLKKIHYPTGGNTEFIYGHNRYKSVQTAQVKNGPGLRVEEIIDHDNVGGTVVRTFRYGENEQGHGFIDLEPLLSYMINETIHIEYTNSDPSNVNHGNRERIYYSGFVPELSELATRPIRYPMVTEYKGTTNENTGKVVYEYDRIPWGARPMGTNKWDIPEYNYWNTTVLKKMTDFRSIENAGTITFDTIRETTHNYTASEILEIKALHVQRRISATGSQSQATGNYPESRIATGEVLEGNFGPRDIYYFREYEIPVGTKNLTSTTEKMFYDDGTTIENKTTYGYNSNQLVALVQKESSDEETDLVLETHIKYPFDYQATGVLGQMVDPNTNMLNFPIEQQEFKDNEPLKSTRTNYHDWGGIHAMIKPRSIEVKKHTMAYEELVGFFDYDDEGNLSSVSKTDGSPIYYIWGYGGEYPVAKIENFTSSQANTVQALVDAIIDASNADSDNCSDANCSEEQLRTALSNLRSAPELSKSMFTAYTYDPLVGITSVTDPKGYTVYYRYDDFNRLEEVRDADNNRVTDYRYHYKAN